MNIYVREKYSPKLTVKGRIFLIPSDKLIEWAK